MSGDGQGSEAHDVLDKVRRRIRFLVRTRQQMRPVVGKDERADEVGLAEDSSNDPVALTTGSIVIACRSRSAKASLTVVSGRTVTGARVMTSLTNMTFSLLVVS